jgi:hypothetical protein
MLHVRGFDEAQPSRWVRPELPQIARLADRDRLRELDLTVLDG